MIISITTNQVGRGAGSIESIEIEKGVIAICWPIVCLTDDEILAGCESIDGAGKGQSVKRLEAFIDCSPIWFDRKKELSGIGTWE